VSPPYRRRLLLEHLEARLTLSYTTIVNNGPSQNRLDLVFMGDGYTQSQLGTLYPQHIDEMLHHLFSEDEDPFPRYAKFFNVHRIDIASAQSGADVPPNGIFRDTALGASYYGDGVTERLLTIDQSLAAAAESSNLAGAGFTAEMRLVAVNDTRYGGSGGPYAVFAGGDSSSTEVALHELGHSFAHLADQYVYPGYGTYPGSEPTAPDATISPTGAKWSAWLNYDQPNIGVIGAYEGANFYEHGIYRPSLDSKMRSLGRPFDAVGREQFILRIYDHVDPLDSWRGNTSTVTDSQPLWVKTVDPSVISVDWSVNGTLVLANGGEQFDPAKYGYKGTVTVTAKAIDRTDWVRQSLDKLQESITWTDTVSSPNVAPTLDAIPDPAAILEGAGAQSISLNNITAGAGDSQALMVTVTSDNTSLIPTPSVTYTPNNNTGSISYTPVADHFGSAKITVTVRDAGADGTFNNSDDGTFVRTFTVNVTGVNDPPTLTAISDPAAILEDAALQTVNLSGISAGPFETQTITITATSDNPGLIPNPTVNYTSANATGSLTYKPVGNQSGKAVITVTVQDNGGKLNSGTDTIVRSFFVNVTAVNDLPSLDAILDVAIAEDSTEQTVNLTGISAGPFESQKLSISTSSSNQTLIPNLAVHYASADTSRSLTYTPNGGTSGTSVITVFVHDAGLDGVLNNDDDGMFERTFTVRVLSPDDINRAPSFDIGTVQPVTDETRTVDLPQFVTNISAGTPQETEQQTVTLSLSLSKDDQKLFTTGPTVTNAGRLTFRPAFNARGTAHITIQAKDNGGTAVGGSDTSSQVFDIEISKLRIWTNSRNARDVNDDHFVVGDDVITIINYINARGSGKIPANLPIGPPYYDVDDDGFIVGSDVIDIINYINAGRGGAGEAPPEGEAVPIGSEAAAIDPTTADSVFQSFDNNLMALTLTDDAESRRK
jgi:hypothetical protein